MENTEDDIDASMNGCSPYEKIQIMYSELLRQGHDESLSVGKLCENIRSSIATELKCDDEKVRLYKYENGFDAHGNDPKSSSKPFSTPTYVDGLWSFGIGVEVSPYPKQVGWETYPKTSYIVPLLVEVKPDTMFLQSPALESNFNLKRDAPDYGTDLRRFAKTFCDEFHEMLRGWVDGEPKQKGIGFLHKP